MILRNWQAPGDIVNMTAAVRDLHLAYPGEYLTDIQGTADWLWRGNRYITSLDEKAPDVALLELDNHPLIDQSNQGPFFFIHLFRDGLERTIGRPIPATDYKGHIEITPDEQLWRNPIYEHIGEERPYWLVNAGHKTDFTIKMWDHAKYQKVVNAFPDVLFVQTGVVVSDPNAQTRHIHAPLKGPNVLNMLNRLNERDSVLSMYHAYGALTGISFPHILAYSTPPNPWFKRKSRAAIIVAGGREPNHWQQGPNQIHIHTCGVLDCCDYGGCWKSRVVPIGDGDEKDEKELCEYPEKTKDGADIARCMNMITAEEVIMWMKRFMDSNPIFKETKWKPLKTPELNLP